MYTYKSKEYMIISIILKLSIILYDNEGCHCFYMYKGIRVLLHAGLADCYMCLCKNSTDVRNI